MKLPSINGGSNPSDFFFKPSPLFSKKKALFFIVGGAVLAFNHETSKEFLVRSFEFFQNTLFQEINVEKSDNLAPYISAVVGTQNIAKTALGLSAFFLLPAVWAMYKYQNSKSESTKKIEKPENQKNPLIRLAESGKIKEIQELFGGDEQSISIEKRNELVNATDQEGKSALHRACENGHQEVIDYLIEKGANLNLCDKEGNTPYDLACKKKHSQVLQHLIKSSPQKFDGSLLHIACERGKVETILTLLDLGLDVNAKDRFGNTPLHIACKKGNFPIAEILLDHKATVNVYNKSDETPIDCIPLKNEAFVELLLHQGAQYKKDPRQEDIAKLNNGAKKGDLKKIQSLQNIQEIRDSYDTVRFENTPLHHACRNGHLEVAEFLLKAGASVDALNKKENTPLHFACENGHTEIIKLLKNYGADFATQNTFGETPFYLAALNERVETVEYLIQEKLNIYPEGESDVDLKKKISNVRALIDDPDLSMEIKRQFQKKKHSNLN